MKNCRNGRRERWQKLWRKNKLEEMPTTADAKGHGKLWWKTTLAKVPTTAHPKGPRMTATMLKTLWPEAGLEKMPPNVDRPLRGGSRENCGENASLKRPGCNHSNRTGATNISAPARNLDRNLALHVPLPCHRKVPSPSSTPAPKTFQRTRQV